MVTMQKSFHYPLFSVTLKSMSNRLKSFMFAQLSVDKIVGGSDKQCGSEVAWYNNG